MSLPIVLIDGRLPRPIIRELEKIAEPLLIPEQPGVYEAIAAHPDIFFCPINTGLVHAPLLDLPLLESLQRRGIQLVAGSKTPGASYPASVPYNAVVTPDFLIHYLPATDPTILHHSSQRRQILVKQGYTRCSLLPLPGNNFITSDRGIEKKLIEAGLEVFYYPPDDIMLPGLRHGFIGGCAGVLSEKVVFTGRPTDEELRSDMEKFINKAGMQVVYLSEGNLLDAGSLLFIEKG
ncbi:MAG: DUF6873 family GME fold protein [Bacteroidales bacterium]